MDEYSHFLNTIKNIRNILRTETIFGRDSINYCIAFLVIRSLDESLCRRLHIDNKYTFDNLFKHENIDELYEKICNLKSELITKLDMSFLHEFKIKSKEKLYKILF